MARSSRMVVRVEGELPPLQLPEAVQRANWIGSRAVQSRGDMEGLPTRSELIAEFEAADREQAHSYIGSALVTGATANT